MVVLIGLFGILFFGSIAALDAALVLFALDHLRDAPLMVQLFGWGLVGFIQACGVAGIATLFTAEDNA